MKKVNWLKILGVAVLIHIILIGLSILTVAIYSYAINPGQTQEFYEEFANKSAPYVSMIAGFILVYLFVIRLNKGKETDPFIIGLGLPIVYLVIDYLLVISMIPDWTQGLSMLLTSGVVKILAGIIAAYRSNLSKKVNEEQSA